MSIENSIDMTDFEWSQDGDWVIRNGDISDTIRTIGQGFIQEVEDRVSSAYKDWKLLPNRGANLDRFYGEINNQETWKAIESAISFSLTSDSFLSSSDFFVTVAPLSNTEIATRIDFNTSLTSVTPDSKIVVRVIYNLEGQGPFIVR